MNKTMMITMGAIALGTFTATAQDLPSPAALPTPASGVIADDGVPAEEFEDGALCKTYFHNDRGGFFNQGVESLSSFLESVGEVDKGFDTSTSRFDAKKVAKPGHEYDTATWEGRFNAPISEEYKFTVRGARGCPFILTINGQTIKGSGQKTLRVNLVKGIGNTVYIANGSPNPIVIEYTLAKYAKAETYTLVPSALKHIVEDEVPDFKLQ